MEETTQSVVVNDEIVRRAAQAYTNAVKTDAFGEVGEEQHLDAMQAALEAVMEETTASAEREHLQAVLSDRGFARLPAIPGAYGGEASVYESSAASGPHVWLNVEVPADLNKPDGPKVEATLHLTAENATKLAEQLLHTVANHYQGGASRE